MAGVGVGRSDPQIATARLLIGLTQGLALLALHEAVQRHLWPARDPAMLAGLTLAWAYGPLPLLAGLDQVRGPTLAAWTLLATTIAGAFAAWAAFSVAPGAAGDIDIASGFPGFAVCVASAMALFIGHHLIVPADAVRRWRPPYGAYFDTAWLDAARLALALAFTGAFWAMLNLGAGLFSAIGINGFNDLIAKPAFQYPATGLVFAAAVHLTAVQARLTLGLRTVGLTLISWLTPVMAGIAVAFLATLPFTGLEPLWRAGSATALLLGSSVAIVLLVNATYQDGRPATPPPALLRLAARIAAASLTPLVVIADYGLFLRLDQHGLTPSRVLVAAAALVASGYAVGYLAAAARNRPWLGALERTNVVMAYVDLAVIVALFTPLADPARLSVADQVARLVDGRTSPAAFDYRFLRFQAGQAGVAALHRLVSTGAGHRSAVSRDAAAALAWKDTWEARPSRQNIADDLTPVPSAAAIPKDFVGSVPADVLGQCSMPLRCEVYAMRLAGIDEILVQAFDEDGRAVDSLIAFARGADGEWKRIGTYAGIACPAEIDALRASRIGSLPAKWPDLEIAGARVPFLSEEAPDPCPRTAPSAPPAR